MTFLHHPLRLAGLVAAIGVVLGDAGYGSTVVFTNQHIDFEAEFHDGQVELGFHDEDNDIHYELEDWDVIIAIEPGQTVRRNGFSATAAFDFLGVAPGEEMYVLPFSFSPSDLNFLFGDGTAANAPDVVFLGLANALRPTYNSINFEFQRDLFEGPGVFSLFTAFGNLMASSAVDSPNSAASTVHDHYNWAFSTAGTYVLPFRVTGTNAQGQSFATGIQSFTVQVVPEPASVALMGLGVLVVGGSAVARRVRRRREATEEMAA